MKRSSFKWTFHSALLWIEEDPYPGMGLGSRHEAAQAVSLHQARIGFPFKAPNTHRGVKGIKGCRGCKRPKLHPLHPPPPLHLLHPPAPPLRHPFKVAQNTVYLGKGADARERPFQQAQSGRKGVDEGRRAPR